jgi:hypothetical protein
MKCALDRLGYAGSPGAFRRAPGFAALTPEERWRAAMLGGKAAQAKGTAHRFTAGEAQGARKGVAARRRKRRREPT